MESLAGEIVKGFVLESAKSLAGGLVTRIEIFIAKGFKANLRDLQRELERFDGLLAGADSGARSSGNQVLDAWLKKVSGVAHQAEDLVDEYAYEIHKESLAQKRRVKVQVFFSQSNPVVSRLRIAHKFHSLKESIAEVYAEAQKLGIKPVEVAAADHHHHPPLHLAVAKVASPSQVINFRRRHPNYEGLIGRDTDKAKITGLLRDASSSDRRLSVIGVYGMGGVGKTTLCQNIFKAKDIEDYFEEKIWICVSHDFDFAELLNGKAEQLDKQSPAISRIEAFIVRLEKKVQSKKYLLVLDDVWDTFGKVWEVLRCSLQNVGGSRGNTILVTSRCKKTLEELRTDDCDSNRAMVDPFIYRLGSLEDGDGWSLFQQRVGDDLCSNSKKVTIGRRMFQKCGGIPLAIRTLGDLLRSRKQIREWMEIEESGIWNENDGFLPSIKLSFKYLPSAQLKRCFVYCAIFQEDEIIEKDVLIKLWMAQGFLQPYYKMEQVGEEYFDILLNSSLFQEVRSDEWGNVEACKMHDIVHAVAQSISRHNILEIQHVSLDFRQHQSLELGDNLRSLMIKNFDIARLDELTTYTQSLRVLVLATDSPIEELPDLMGELKHLRYLEIRGESIKSLPEGLSKLYNLQTLRVDSDGIDFPMVPIGFSQLVNLRHLCTSWSSAKMGIPIGLGKLTCLQTLPTIDASKDWKGSIIELETLNNLKGSVTICGLDLVKTEQVEKVNCLLGMKQNIHSLSLEFAGEHGSRGYHNQIEDEGKDKRVLKALQPPPNLVVFELKLYKSKTLPQWMMKMEGYEGCPLSYIKSLKIYNCSRLEQLPSFESLVDLKALYIERCPCLTSPPILEPLISLERLVVTSCNKMENLPEMASNLVNLMRLSITHCTNMTSLPAWTSNLPSLKFLELGPFNPHLDILPCPPMFSTSIEELYLDAEGMDKVQSLPEQIQSLHQLRRLSIQSFSALETLPGWLGSLTNLQMLELEKLPRLKCLPSQAAMGELTQMQTLRIHGCGLLIKACARNVGSDWSKIKHIPDVKFR